MSATPTQIVRKYLASSPTNIQLAPRNASAVHRDFLLYVGHYRQQLPTSINVESIPSENVAFFQTALSSLFHMVFVRSVEPMYGSANVQLVKLNRDGETYRLELYGMMQPRIVYEFNDAALAFSPDGNGLTLKSNGPKGEKKLELKRLKELKDFNEYTPELEHNPVQIWQIKITEGAMPTPILCYHLVILTM